MTTLNTVNSLTFTERVARVAIGSTLIGTVFATNGELGWLALVPLIGIYPALTGLVGADPLRAIIRDRLTWRVAQGITGAALVSTAFVAAAPLGVVAILPLLGAWYALAALLGRSPLAAANDATRAIVRIVAPTETTPTTSAVGATDARYHRAA